VLVDGTARATTAAVPAEDREQMTAVLRYLVEKHGTGSIDPWFEGRLAEIDTIGGTGTSERGEARERAHLIMRHLGMEPVGPDGARIGEFVTYQAQPQKELRPIRGFGFALTFADLQTDRFTAGADTIDLRMDESQNLLRISRNGVQLLEVSFADLLERAAAARILAYPECRGHDLRDGDLAAQVRRPVGDRERSGGRLSPPGARGRPLSPCRLEGRTRVLQQPATQPLRLPACLKEGYAVETRSLSPIFRSSDSKPHGHDPRICI
jgi:hypothetical protein